MSGRRGPGAIAGAAALALAAPACAQVPASGVDPARGDAIIVFGRALEQVGIATSGSQGVVGYADFEHRPISRTGELAENVPGLVATQHSGSGKANQFFLRGFNLDHGTDLAGYVDGAPVNMRSHGHGQGYLDLNFLIPELVERIDYAKGPYHAEHGDFAAAGAMAFTTRSRLERPFAELAAGAFGYRRALAAGSGEVGQGTLIGAVEGTLANGPWVLDENQRKLNALVKYSAAAWSLALSGYRNRWTSTDQVPERAVAAGLIPRRGFIDPNLGGRATRLGATFNAHLGATALAGYALASRLRLTSNFTYFLDDPANGDQFRQVDRRGVFGGSLRHRFATGRVAWRVGADARFDRIGTVGLYRTLAGAVRRTVREDRVDEYGGGLFGEAEARLSPALRVVLGLRGDAIGYRVRADDRCNSGAGWAAIVTPKAALAWQPERGVELYANYGEGYHSNDVRGATIGFDPVSGEAAGRVPVFARARGAELGTRVERGGLTASLVGFRLDLASELVFVGDAGTTEANAASRRHGGELALFWKAGERLTLDATAAVTRARFRGVAAGLRRIPGAVPRVLAGGATARLSPELTATARVRHFSAAPLAEDGSQRSRATTLVNLAGYWDRGGWRIGAELLNLFDADDPDISYFYASRLPGEPAAGIEDRHVHPVEPRQLRVSVRASW